MENNNRITSGGDVIENELLQGTTPERLAAMTAPAIWQLVHLIGVQGAALRPSPMRSANHAVTPYSRWAQQYMDHYGDEWDPVATPVRARVLCQPPGSPYDIDLSAAGESKPTLYRGHELAVTGCVQDYRYGYFIMEYWMSLDGYAYMSGGTVSRISKSQDGMKIPGVKELGEIYTRLALDEVAALPDWGMINMSQVQIGPTQTNALYQYLMDTIRRYS